MMMRLSPCRSYIQYSILLYHTGTLHGNRSGPGTGLFWVWLCIIFTKLRLGSGPGRSGLVEQVLRKTHPTGRGLIADHDY